MCKDCPWDWRRHIFLETSLNDNNELKKNDIIKYNWLPPTYIIETFTTPSSDYIKVYIMFNWYLETNINDENLEIFRLDPSIFYFMWIIVFTWIL